MVERRQLFSASSFTWLHVPKTGGTWLHGVLTRHCPASWDAMFGPPAHVTMREVDYVMGAQGVPASRIDLPRIAVVRNPWDWYVSFYFFLEQHRVNHTGGFSARVIPAPLASWRDHYARGNSVDGFRCALPKLLEDLHRGALRVMPPQSEFLFRGTELRAMAVRFERLRDGFVSALESVGAEVTPGLRAAITSSRATNRSGHARYDACYDGPSRKLVERYEGPLIDTFGYRFGD